MKAPPKIVCLESYWNEQMFQTFSVKGFLEAMAPLIHPPLTVAHRFVESEAGIAYYLRRPGGVMWRQKELFDAIALPRPKSRAFLDHIQSNLSQTIPSQSQQSSLIIP